MTLRAWAAKAFKMLVWQVTFMPECTHKREVIQFLLDAPNELKQDFWKEMK